MSNSILNESKLKETIEDLESIRLRFFDDTSEGEEILDHGVTLMDILIAHLEHEGLGCINNYLKEKTDPS